RAPQPAKRADAAAAVELDRSGLRRGAPGHHAGRDEEAPRARVHRPRARRKWLQHHAGGGTSGYEAAEIVAVGEAVRAEWRSGGHQVMTARRRSHPFGKLTTLVLALVLASGCIAETGEPD